MGYLSLTCLLAALFLIHPVSVRADGVVLYDHFVVIEEGGRENSSDSYLKILLEGASEVKSLDEFDVKTSLVQYHNEKYYRSIEFLFKADNQNISESIEKKLREIDTGFLTSQVSQTDQGLKISIALYNPPSVEVNEAFLEALFSAFQIKVDQYPALGKVMNSILMGYTKEQILDRVRGIVSTVLSQKLHEGYSTPYRLERQLQPLFNLANGEVNPFLMAADILIDECGSPTIENSRYEQCMSDVVAMYEYVKRSPFSMLQDVEKAALWLLNYQIKKNMQLAQTPRSSAATVIPPSDKEKLWKELRSFIDFYDERTKVADSIQYLMEQRPELAQEIDPQFLENLKLSVSNSKKIQEAYSHEIKELKTYYNDRYPGWFKTDHNEQDKKVESAEPSKEKIREKLRPGLVKSVDLAFKSKLNNIGEILKDPVARYLMGDIKTVGILTKVELPFFRDKKENLVVELFRAVVSKQNKFNERYPDLAKKDSAKTADSHDLDGDTFYTGTLSEGFVDLLDLYSALDQML